METGEWEQAEPHGTIFNDEPAAPDEDATPGDGNVMAMVTQNCVDDCDDAGASDVDGGPTYLTSPVVDLNGADGVVSYAQWFFGTSTNGEDFLHIEVSNDGGLNWTSVSTALGTDGAWEVAEFRIGQYVTPTSDVRVRFSVRDDIPPSIVEAGVDDFVVSKWVCASESPVGDLDGDGDIDAADLAQLLGNWGPCADPDDCPADLDGDGSVGAFDLAILLGNWG